MIRERGTPIASQTAMASSSGPRPSASSPSWTVIQMSSGLKPKPVEREVPGVLGRALLEVLADREVAEHLEEGQVPGRRADVLDVDGAEALLAGGDERVGRLLDAQEVGLQRLHARGREQDRGVVARGHERPAGQAQVVALLEEAQEELADLVGGHAAIVAHPSTASPRRKTAVCPGAGPSTGSGELDRLAAQRAGHRRRAVAQLDGVDLAGRRVQARVADADAGRGQRGARPDGDGVGARVGAQHVERLGRAPELQAAALADGEAVRAARGAP